MRGQTASMPTTEVFETVAPSEPWTERVGGQVELALIGRILWRRRKAIAFACLGAMAATLVYCLLATPQYTAFAQILVDPRDKQVVSNDVNPSSIAADGGVTQVESQGSVLLSNKVLLRAIDATHLESDPEFNGVGRFAAITRWLSVFSKPQDAEQKLEDLQAKTLTALRKHASYKRADKVLVLDLAVYANDPDKAAAIANAIADAYLADQTETRADAGREASKSLTSRLGELQAKVQEAEDAVEDYRAKNNFVMSTGQLVSDQEINQTTAQLTAAQNRASSLRAQLDQLHSDPGVQGTPEAMASGVMVRLRDRESAIVEKLSSASRQLGPLHPDIASLEQSLKDVRGLIAKEIQRLRQAAEADYARAVDDQRSLSRKLDGMKSKSLEDNKADVHLRELQRQADAARSIYQAFLLRAQETMEAANVDTANSRIITRALRPQQKSWPPTLLLLLASGLGGLSLGASATLAREYLNPSLLTSAQARQLVDAPVLGVVAGRDLARERVASSGSRSHGKTADNVARSLLRKLPNVASPDEAKIGACIYLLSPSSAAAARARFAERLADFSVREGRQTLLVDADLSTASHADRGGLLEVLRGEQTVSDLAYIETDDRYSRLAKGGVDPEDWRPRENNDAFRLRRMRRCYDLVILDAGSMTENDRLATLAGQCDLLALVAEIGQPQAEVAAEAEAAALAQGKFDAIVLVDPTNAL
jgi:uncharacterized protein involved in exopolysaccharide biosynthesis